MVLHHKARKKFREIKRDYSQFQKKESIGSRLERKGKKMGRKIKKSGKLKKIRRKAIGLRDNIDAYYREERKKLGDFEQGKIRF